MNTYITQTIDTFAVFVGLTGVAVILTGVLHGLYHFISLEFGTRSKYISHDAIRYRLGVYLLLGLEFLVAADIMETVFKPSLEQLSILGGIVIIRTLLNYFLNKELEHIKNGNKLKNNET